MKLTPKMRTIIVLGIGSVLILFGAIQGIFKLKLNEKVVNEVVFFLMVMAAGIYFGGRKKSEPEEKEAKEQEPSADISKDDQET